MAGASPAMTASVQGAQPRMPTNANAMRTKIETKITTDPIEF
jgi:hypothetical protein